MAAQLLLLVARDHGVTEADCKLHCGQVYVLDGDAWNPVHSLRAMLVWLGYDPSEIGDYRLPQLSAPAAR